MRLGLVAVVSVLIGVLSGFLFEQIHPNLGMMGLAVTISIFTCSREWRAV